MVKKKCSEHNLLSMNDTSDMFSWPFLFLRVTTTSRNKTLRLKYQHPHWTMTQEPLLSHSNNQNSQTKAHKEVKRSCEQNHSNAKALHHMTFSRLSWVDFRLTTELCHVEQVLRNHCENWPKGNLISASYLKRGCLLFSHNELQRDGPGVVIFARMLLYSLFRTGSYSDKKLTVHSEKLTQTIMTAPVEPNSSLSFQTPERSARGTANRRLLVVSRH